MNFKELNRFDRKISCRNAALAKLEREVQNLSNDIDLMRKERMKAEANKILQEPSPRIETPKTGGGKWWGQGDRVPSREEMTSKNMPEILKEFDQLIKENK